MRDANLATLEGIRTGWRPWPPDRAKHGPPRTSARRAAARRSRDAGPRASTATRRGAGAKDRSGYRAGALVRGERVAAPWIHCTDADVALPTTYFEAATPGTPTARNASSAADGSGVANGSVVANDSGVTDRSVVVGNSDAALLYPFRHVRRDAGSARIRSLAPLLRGRASVRGFTLCVSHHRQHTRSTRHRVRSSARISEAPGRRGFLPAQQTREGRNDSLAHGEPIRLSARISNRTPFGTGRALERAAGA